MRIACGLEYLDFEVAESKLLAVHRQEPAVTLTDPAAAVRSALESPIGFPALRRALIPDDHVAVVIDDRLPQLARLLMPVLEHIRQANVAPEAITLVCPAHSHAQPWLDDLSDDFADARLEVHDPTDRKRLSYLAATRQGRRIYLNRTVVDADQVVLLTGRGYDPLLGYSGAEAALFPALSDEATRQELGDKLSMTVPGTTPWPVRREAAEVAWQLGAPFLVQVIEGSDPEVVHVLGGPIETSGDGQRLLDARWRVEVDAPADIVVAGMGGDPSRHTFGDLARAFACAARVVKSRGRIVLLCAAEPALGPGSEVLRQAGDAAAVLSFLEKHKVEEREAVFHWASAADQATLYLLSKLSADLAEELFTVPLSDPSQVQKLVSGPGTCLVLPDAHKTMAVVRSS